MVPSIKSLIIFFSLNSFLLSFSFFGHIFIKTIETKKLKVLLLIFYYVFKNYALLYFVKFLSKNKENINKSSIILKNNTFIDFNKQIIIVSIMEYLTSLIISKYYKFTETIILQDVLYFIPTSFLFEIIFDFFHYFSHRLLHTKYLYANIHKKHHKYLHTEAHITFYHSPLDLLLTNIIPFLITLIIFPKISHFQLNTILTYKTFGEICGHIGKKCYPTSSFCQFIWLPRIFNIELYTEDHNLHHLINECNYSKRFSLWDKIFGTYENANK